MRKALMIVYCVFILGIISLADMGKLPLRFLSLLPHYDWLAHLLLYALFYFIMYGAMRNRGAVLWILFLVIVIEEVSQLFLVYRTFSVVDLLMGVLGVLLSYSIIKMKRAASEKNALESNE
jgi:VanZ family protein